MNRPLMARQVVRSAVRLLRALVIAYLAVIVILIGIERSLIYPIPPRSNLNTVLPSGCEVVWLEGADGIKVHGWFLPHPNPKATVLFFHGNGEDVSNCGPQMAQWRDTLAINVLVMEYRGYGQSEGKPSEKALVADGLDAANWAAKRVGVPVSDLVLWGRSIGGGVAAGVAASIHPKAMIMECTFDSLANVAAEHIRWIPVRWLMTNQYRSASRLSSYEGNFIQWHGDQDNVVSLKAAERLFAAVPSKRKSFFLAQGIGHNDRPPAKFEAEVRRLFSSIESTGEAI